MIGTYEVKPAQIVGISHFVTIVIRNANGVEQTFLGDFVGTPYHEPMWDDATQTMTVWVEQTTTTYATKKHAAEAVRELRKLGYVKAKSV